MKRMNAITTFLISLCLSRTWAFIPPSSSYLSSNTELCAIHRRDILGLVSSVAVTTALRPNDDAAYADAAATQDSMNVENFLRTGGDSGGNMGVSSQAGKSRPQTGVVFRDGTDVLRDKRSGRVSAELLTGTKSNPRAVLVSFVSPWKLETGSVFDVECRDAKTGDGAFLAVTRSVDGKSLEDLPSAFFLERLFDATGRFSFYGPPTDVKVKSSKIVGRKRIMEVNFSYLSQSTNAEIPRKAVLVATLPEGSDNAILLVGSTKATRWKTVQEEIMKTADSFQAIPSPKTSLRLRAKDRTNGSAIFE